MVLLDKGDLIKGQIQAQILQKKDSELAAGGVVSQYRKLAKLITWIRQWS